MVGIFAVSCNQTPPPDPEVVILVPSDKAFADSVAIDQINVAKAPSFYFAGVSGDRININPNTGVATVYVGESSYELYPPQGFALTGVKYKPEGVKRDAVLVEGKIKVKTGKKKDKEVDKAVSYWVFADCNRELGVSVDKKGVLVDNKTTKANRVEVKPVAVEVEKQIKKKDMKTSDKFVRDVPVAAKKK